MIKLEIVGDTLEDFNHKVRAILGELARDMGASVSRLETVAETAQASPDKQEATENVVSMKTASEAIAEAEDSEKAKRNTAARKYGESDWDKKRRTKEQMAVDTEIEELTSALGIEIDKTVPADRLVVLLREQSASATDETDTPNISSSPEDRKDPGETEAEIVYTRDDVRDLLGKYAEKFGMAQAQKEGPKLLGAPKLSEIPDDNEAFATAVRNLQEAIDG
ncbi:hypothetical protein RZ532_01165 [Nitratireductor aquimarinus]|uniref:hypothetical protein n=1 Tax=Nitratireductor aquimarinus TaxID=889300 RepID=UPI002936184D|nr:hypothetical protein [Nitratireductor aquimarinus]MDV2964571.1 hypothetical protein [Nitratireductor aquimarinus]